MRRKSILALLLLAALLLTAGCGKTNTTTTGNSGSSKSTTGQDSNTASTATKDNPVKTVSRPDQFIKLYQDWTNRLEGIAKDTISAYNDWNTGKLNQKDFTAKINSCYNRMLQLNQQTDLNTQFTLSNQDQQKVNYAAVTKAYGMASKDINDFLYIAVHVQNAKTKAQYQDLVANKYQAELPQLKQLLNQ